MKALQLVLTSFLIQAVFSQDKWEDIAAEHNGMVTESISGLTNESTVNRDTRTYGAYGYYNRPSSGQQSFLAANRYVDQLLRQSNGDISAVVASLEKRYNVQWNGNSDLRTRINAIANAVNAGLSASGFGYYQPIVNAVAERIGTIVTAGGHTGTQGNMNGQWSGSGSGWSQTSGSSQRPTSSYPGQANLQGSVNWGTQPSGSWGGQPSGSAQGSATFHIQANGNTQANRPSSSNIQASANFWPSEPNGPRPQFMNEPSDDDWPPVTQRPSGQRPPTPIVNGRPAPLPTFNQRP